MNLNRQRFFGDVERLMGAWRGRTAAPPAKGRHERSSKATGAKRKLKTPAGDEDPEEETDREFEFDVDEFLKDFDKDSDKGISDIKLVEADDYIAAVKELGEEARRSHKRRELHGDRLLKLAGHMKTLHEGYLRQQAVIEELKKKPRSLGTGSENGVDLSGLANRLRVPKRFAKEPLYYVLTAQDPARLGYAASFDGLDNRAMTPHVRAFVERRLINDVTQARVYENQFLNDVVMVVDAWRAQDKDSEYAQTPRHLRIRSLRCFKQWKRSYMALRDGAMDTLTTNEGLEWVIPTMMSSQLHLLVQAQLVLADQFEWPTMPGPSWKDPVEGEDPIAYLVDQATDDPADALAKPPASTIGTRNFQLDAVKAMARVVLATEVEEDLQVDAVPRVLLKLARAHAFFKERAIVNGFRSALSGFDTGDVPPARDARLAWNGVRWFQKSVQAGLTGGQTLEVDLSTMSATALANMMGVQKQYGAISEAQNCFFLTGYSGAIRFLTLYDTASGQPIVLTREKMGDRATLFTGTFGEVFGRPIVVSRDVREDLNASGIYDGATKTKTIVLHVHRMCFKGGERRAYRVRRLDELKAETDQIGIVSSWRGDFKPVNHVGQQLFVSLGKNVASF